ncbi:MAG: hypothetical protein AAF821_10880 [Cyanobacteria bacterium P01_D01_bin.156]
MSIKKSEIIKCGACRFYTPVGRRGGDCSQLSVPVQSGWKTCCLAQSPFESVPEITAPDRQLVVLDAQEVLESLPVTPRPFLEPIAEPDFTTAKVSA